MLLLHELQSVQPTRLVAGFSNVMKTAQKREADKKTEKKFLDLLTTYQQDVEKAKVAKTVKMASSQTGGSSSHNVGSSSIGANGLSTLGSKRKRSISNKGKERVLVDEIDSEDEIAIIFSDNEKEDETFKVGSRTKKATMTTEPVRRSRRYSTRTSYTDTCDELPSSSKEVSSSKQGKQPEGEFESEAEEEREIKRRKKGKERVTESFSLSSGGSSSTAILPSEAVDTDKANNTTATNESQAKSPIRLRYSTRVANHTFSQAGSNLEQTRRSTRRTK
jgi:hypothetical protein